MDIGGKLASTVIRLVVLVATLAATYYFIIRPILNTTEKVSAGMGNSIQRNLDQVFRQVNISEHTQTVISRKVKDVPQNRINRLQRCIGRAGTDINRIQRCANRFSR